MEMATVAPAEAPDDFIYLPLIMKEEYQ
jgi:hypothetical protein